MRESRANRWRILTSSKRQNRTVDTRELELSRSQHQPCFFKNEIKRYRTAFNGLAFKNVNQDYLCVNRSRVRTNLDSRNFKSFYFPREWNCTPETSLSRTFGGVILGLPRWGNLEIQYKQPHDQESTRRVHISSLGRKKSREFLPIRNIWQNKNGNGREYQIWKYFLER